MKLTNLKNILSGAALAAVMTCGGAIVANAQQAPTASPDNTTIENQRGGFGRGGFRHGGRGGKRGGNGFREFSQLNLTDAQKEQLQQIAARYRESNKALFEQARANRQNGKTDATTDGTFNESAVRAAATADNNARVELAVAAAKMRSEMYNVLTAEQKTQLEALKAERKQRFEQRREQFKAQQSPAPSISK